MQGNGDTLTTLTATGAVMPGDPTATPPDPQRRVRLGEELPIFCERCGYSLHGLPRARCEHCEVLHLACPECNHHQPINTLRPAFQRMLGRVRSLALTLSVLGKIGVIFGSLVLWGALGTEIAYSYSSYGTRPGGQTMHQQFQLEVGVIVFLFAAAYGMVGRMLLLRWARGTYVGMALGAAVAVALCCGAYVQWWDYTDRVDVVIPQPIGPGFTTYLLCAFAGAVMGAACVWGIWMSLVRVFLPPRAATALLDWQRAMSATPGDTDVTDRTASVIA
jgi:hypothetical protein